MKKGMLFGLSHKEKRVKKINLLHFPVFTSKSFVILKLPSTDSKSMCDASLIFITIISPALVGTNINIPTNKSVLYIFGFHVTS